ncbi:MAG: hypothetical protein GF381_02330 [Candidatus Pacebacteria bacterium]|nr:hypothetical protein [Candidatus Paceibacterota bacterium]
MKYKKYYPFIFPAVALIIVGFLAFRWYKLRTQRERDLSLQQVEIENLTPEESDIVKQDTGAEVVDLENGEEIRGMGEVRYTIKNNKVLLSVNATLPEIDGQYQVWFKPEGSEVTRKAFVLDMGKGGLMGSAAVSTDLLPFEVVVTEELSPADEMMETEVLRGMVKAKVEVEAETEESAQE